ncbi:hypothetical protein DFJ73DRAFT_505168 [Zopfochytrium polystomum]|nr:hypothetical protein DFJ73DRAFT_505168 [Zopfochytrium polystomum]
MGAATTAAAAATAASSATASVSAAAPSLVAGSRSATARLNKPGSRIVSPPPTGGALADPSMSSTCNAMHFTPRPGAFVHTAPAGAPMASGMSVRPPRMTSSASLSPSLRRRRRLSRATVPGQVFVPVMAAPPGMNAVSARQMSSGTAAPASSRIGSKSTSTSGNALASFLSSRSGGSASSLSSSDQPTALPILRKSASFSSASAVPWPVVSSKPISLFEPLAAKPAAPQPVADVAAESSAASSTALSPEISGAQAPPVADFNSQQSAGEETGHSSREGVQGTHIGVAMAPTLAFLALGAGLLLQQSDQPKSAATVAAQERLKNANNAATNQEQLEIDSGPDSDGSEEGSSVSISKPAQAKEAITKPTGMFFGREVAVAAMSLDKLDAAIKVKAQKAMGLTLATLKIIMDVLPRESTFPNVAIQSVEELSEPFNKEHGGLLAELSSDINLDNLRQASLKLDPHSPEDSGPLSRLAIALASRWLSMSTLVSSLLSPALIAELEFLREYLRYCVESETALNLPYLFPADFETDHTGAIVKINQPWTVFLLRSLARTAAGIIVALLPYVRKRKPTRRASSKALSPSLPSDQSVPTSARNLSTAAVASPLQQSRSTPSTPTMGPSRRSTAASIAGTSSVHGPATTTTAASAPGLVRTSVGDAGVPSRHKPNAAPTAAASTPLTTSAITASALPVLSPLFTATPPRLFSVDGDGVLRMSPYVQSEVDTAFDFLGVGVALGSDTDDDGCRGDESSFDGDAVGVGFGLGSFHSDATSFDHAGWPQRAASRESTRAPPSGKVSSDGGAESSFVAAWRVDYDGEPTRHEPSLNSAISAAAEPNGPAHQREAEPVDPDWEAFKQREPGIPEDILRLEFEAIRAGFSADP